MPPKQSPTESSASRLNDIPIDQNQDEQLQLLASQRAIYGIAKRWAAVQLICTIVVAFLFTFVGNRIDSFKITLALASLVILFLDSWTFELAQKTLRQRAARIQELFDCKVLQLHWNEFWIGSPPEEEEINEYAATYRNRDADYSRLRDWYSVQSGRLPLHLARLICQRSNLRWDSKLRRIYGCGALGLVLVTLATVLIVGLVSGWSEADFLLTLAMLSPVFGWGVREFFKQKESAENLSTLMEHVKTTWARIIAGELNKDDCARESRELQDAIFDHRRSSPVIFDWVYKLYRSRREKEMGETAEMLIKGVSHLLPEKRGTSAPVDPAQDETNKEHERTLENKGIKK